jgi:hypothetical protein
LFDPNIVLLIQYKTVQLYTPLEHKNLSIVAKAGPAEFPMVILTQLPECLQIYRFLILNATRSGSYSLPGILALKEYWIFIHLFLTKYSCIDFYLQIFRLQITFFLNITLTLRSRAVASPNFHRLSSVIVPLRLFLTDHQILQQDPGGIPLMCHVQKFLCTYDTT